MFKNISVFNKRLDRMVIFALVCGFALIMSACAGAAVNSTDSTPTNGKETLPPTGQTTEAPVGTLAALPQTSGADQDVCSLITAAEAEAVMGQPVTSINPFSELDSDYGEMVSSCYFIGNDLTVIVSMVDLGSAQTASTMLQQKLVNEQTDNTDASISEESGLGEKAYWTITENAGIYSFMKGSKILVVGLVGNVGDAALYKAALLTLAKNVASKY